MDIKQHVETAMKAIGEHKTRAEKAKQFFRGLDAFQVEKAVRALHPYIQSWSGDFNVKPGTDKNLEVTIYSPGDDGQGGALSVSLVPVVTLDKLQQVAVEKDSRWPTISVAEFTIAVGTSKTVNLKYPIHKDAATSVYYMTILLWKVWPAGQFLDSMTSTTNVG